MPKVVNQKLTPKTFEGKIDSLAKAVRDVILALCQYSKQLNRENHLQILQLTLHANSNIEHNRWAFQ